jgi:PhzF family phenazine biosynthesis protein
VATHFDLACTPKGGRIVGLKIVQVDAFTATPFAGNPAAVCLLPAPREATWMQKVAQEMNLSETAFLVKRADGFDLRWFTPLVEVDLCGHATLASAHVVWEEGQVPADTPVHFYTRSGLLTATRQGAWIALDFPAQPVEPVPMPPGLGEALEVTPCYVGKSREDYLVEVESEATIRQLQPNFPMLKALAVRGVAVTSQATTPGYDFVSRFFAPRVGINEDPVTGSAHCYLGPYWHTRLHKDTLMAYQASPRGGMLRVRVGGPRVYLDGQTVTILRGELLVDV